MSRFVFFLEEPSSREMLRGVLPKILPDDSRIENRYDDLSRGIDCTTTALPVADLKRRVQQIIEEIDDRGRWVSTYRGERLVGQPKFPLDSQYISSDVFSRNITSLSDYLAFASDVQ